MSTTAHRQRSIHPELSRHTVNPLDSTEKIHLHSMLAQEHETHFRKNPWNKFPSCVQRRKTVWIGEDVMALLSPTSILPIFSEDEFVARNSPASRLQALQDKTTFPVEIEYFLRLCHLKRITANPIQLIVPIAHSAHASL